MYTKSETVKGLKTFCKTEIEIRKLVPTTQLKLENYLCKL